MSAIAFAGICDRISQFVRPPKPILLIVFALILSVISPPAYAGRDCWHDGIQWHCRAGCWIAKRWREADGREWVQPQCEHAPPNFFMLFVFAALVIGIITYWRRWHEQKKKASPDFDLLNYHPSDLLRALEDTRPDLSPIERSKWAGEAGEKILRDYAEALKRGKPKP